MLIPLGHGARVGRGGPLLSSLPLRPCFTLLLTGPFPTPQTPPHQCCGAASSSPGVTGAQPALGTSRMGREDSRAPPAVHLLLFLFTSLLCFLPAAPGVNSPAGVGPKCVSSIPACLPPGCKCTGCRN